MFFVSRVLVAMLMDLQPWSFGGDPEIAQWWISTVGYRWPTYDWGNSRKSIYLRMNPSSGWGQRFIESKLYISLKFVVAMKSKLHSFYFWYNPSVFSHFCSYLLGFQVAQKLTLTSWIIPTARFRWPWHLRVLRAAERLVARALLRRLAAFGAAAVDSLRPGKSADCDAGHSSTGTMHSKPICHLVDYITITIVIDD
jgi:hypothetical protein